jgi:hypothetical protein
MINDTCLFFKTRHGQYQETGPFMDQAHLLKQITVVNKGLDSTHFTLNWSPVDRNPEKQSLNTSKIRPHCMPAQHEMEYRKSRIVAVQKNLKVWPESRYSHHENTRQHRTALDLD